MDPNMSSTTTDNSLRLKVPSTQNTAPVLDFSCLYTHDIRRKAKRWQDGIVRFHTFNNRVMVYDVSRNFVGDTHWREPIPLQDGDDLELDKGVLIQVGESTGSTDQDLSELFKKRRNPGVASPGRTPPVPRAHISTGNSTSVPLSQLRPRTLNSLLGTPKGPLGRAAVPLKSPCQLRKENQSDPIVEARSAKRQRLERPAEDAALPVLVSSIKSAAATGSPSRQQNSDKMGSQMAEKSTARLISVLPQKYTIPREKALVKPTSKEASNRDHPTEKSHNSDPRSSSNGGQSTSKSSGSRRSKETAPGARKDLGEQEKPQEVDIEIGNQVHIVASKPRQKLMYKQLIPQAASSTKSIEEQYSKRAKKPPEKLEGPEVDPQAKFHRAQCDRLKARLERIEVKERNQCHVTGSAESPHLLDSEDDAVSLSSKPDSIEEGPTGTLQRLISSDEQQGRKIARFTPFTKSLISSPTDSDSSIQNKLTRMDEILLQNPKKPEAGNPQVQRPSQPEIRPPLPQRSNTSKPLVPTNLPTTDLETNTSSLLPAPASPHPCQNQEERSHSPCARPLNRSHSLPKGQTIRGPRDPVQKMISDPTTLRRHSASEQRPTTPVLAQDQKPDPWSREAWDLFGYERPEKKGGEV